MIRTLYSQRMWHAEKSYKCARWTDGCRNLVWYADNVCEVCWRKEREARNA